MRPIILFIHLICAFFLISPTAFAHRSYEHKMGTFQRIDGIKISIVKHYIDGIIGADPVSVQFRLCDGTELAKTSYLSDAVILPVVNGVEIYQYERTWLPIATHIDKYDGFQLQDITQDRRSKSPWVHFRGHWRIYSIAVSVGLLLIGLYFCLLLISKRRWYSPLRWIGFASVHIAVFFYACEILIFEPVCPLLIAGFLLPFLFKVLLWKRRNISI